MTPVPPPASPCVRVRLVYNLSDGTELGNRFFLSYSGSTPSGASCATLASDIASAWVAHLASLVQENNVLSEVDVIDIATDTGTSGTWSGSDPGTDSSSPLPTQVANNIEYDIAQRYRGGKPRLYLPPPGNAQTLNQAHWTSGFVSASSSGAAAFFAAVEALSVGSMGTLQHVALSYYKGFHNVTNSSGRTRAAPTYRASALVYPVSGYSAKSLMGSQRRRRTSTTP